MNVCKRVMPHISMRVCAPCCTYEVRVFTRYFTNKTSYAYLPLFMGSWNVQEHLDSNLFWAGDGRFCGVVMCI